MAIHSALFEATINEYFVGDDGPYFYGVHFLVIFVGMIRGDMSGFHAHISPGDTPK